MPIPYVMTGQKRFHCVIRCRGEIQRVCRKKHWQDRQYTFASNDTVTGRTGQPVSRLEFSVEFRASDLVSP